jgi:elongation factor Ts
MATLDQIKKLRELTGAGIVDVKKALTEAGDDEMKAAELLRQRSQEKAGKKADREAKEGIVVSYIHSNNKVGVVMKLLCETDFVARNEEFKALAQDIAMHIVAMNPQFVRIEDAPVEMSDEEKKEVSLLAQAFIKNPEQTVGDLITEKIGKIGENIQVGEFSRLEL